MNYLKDNNYRIAPGKYTINQSDGFEDGMVIRQSFINGETIYEKGEVFKFIENNEK